MMISKRRFSTTVAAGAAAMLLPRSLAAPPLPKARNVVLVHGLFADGSCPIPSFASRKPAGRQRASIPTVHGLDLQSEKRPLLAGAGLRPGDASGTLLLRCHHGADCSSPGEKETSPCFVGSGWRCSPYL